MDPMDSKERSPVLGNRVGHSTASSRFKGLIASQLASLRGALDAAFEQELDLATSRVTESERSCRLAAEANAQSLEQELQELRVELAATTSQCLAASTPSPEIQSLRTAAPLPGPACMQSPSLEAPAPLPVKPLVPSTVAALSPLLAWEAEPDLRFSDAPVLVSDGVADESSHGLNECRSMAPLLEVPTSTSPPHLRALVPPPLGQPNSRWAAPARNGSASVPSGNGAAVTKTSIPKVSSREVLKAAKSDDGRRTPQRQQVASRIPKPSTPSRVQRSLGESFTLEDLDDQRLLNLTTKRPNNGTPVQNRKAEERSTTPQGSRAGGRTKTTGSRDDSTYNSKKGGIRERAMLDKRSLRRMHRDTFGLAINEWRDQHTTPGSRVKRNPACQVFVRMRPIFEKELQNGEFETVSVFEDWGEVIVHNCLFQADLIRMFVHHQGFSFPRTFGPDARDEDVYSECGSNLVTHALKGQLGTLFMFGQTGSGKTYTIDAIMRQASHEIFDAIGENASVRLKVFEIAGKKCSDLLSKQQVELKLLDDEDGRTNIVGATEAPAHSTEDFSRLLQEALARRATASHGRNEESSRSHCICIIDLPDAGSLILVDCAGTERRQDTEQHSSERTRESAEINTSLHALKECIRSRGREQRQARNMEKDDQPHRQVHVPYRGSFLTRVLHESFTRPGSYLAAFGTVSPASLDTEHTLSTLRTLQQLMTDSGHTDAPSFEVKVDVDPKAALRAKRNLIALSPEQKPPLPPRPIGN